MDWLYESPVTIVLLGVLALGALATLWVQSGKNAVLIAVGFVALLLIAGLVTERLVVTDREKVEQEVRDIAADVRSNDRSRLYPHIYSGATELRAKAEGELPSYKFSECTVTKIYRVEIFEGKQPKQAEVEFMVRVAGNFSYQGLEVGGDGSYLRYVTLFFTQEQDGRWRMHDYSHADPSAALVNRPVGK